MEDKTPVQDNERPIPPVRFRKILAPTDFSVCADHAFAYALDLARRFGAEVHLLHVIGPLEGDAYSPIRYSPEAKARQETPEKIAYDHLQAIIDRYDTEGIPIEPVKRHGSAVASTLLHYARAEDIDLIVMGTHGRHGVERLFVGSVAERAVRHAPCSVLTVREQPTSLGKRPEAYSVQRILVPLDFSESSEALLRAACDLAAAYKAQLDLLHVIEPLPFLGTLTGVMTANDLMPHIAHRTREDLQYLWNKVNGADVQAKVHVEEGHAAAHIVDFAARCGIDLIVIASQGRSGMERFLIGSVTERVVRTASCPVFTFKDGATETAASRARVEEEPAGQPGEGVLS